MGLILPHQIFQLPKDSSIQLPPQFIAPFFPKVLHQKAPRPRPLGKLATLKLWPPTPVVSNKTSHQPIQTCQHGDKLVQGHRPASGLRPTGIQLPSQEEGKEAESILLLAEIFLEGSESRAREVGVDVCKPVHADILVSGHQDVGFVGEPGGVDGVLFEGAFEARFLTERRRRSGEGIHLGFLGGTGL